MLTASTTELSRAYDLAMFDLDGVVYIGGEAIPGVADHLERIRRDGMRCAFITNNAARTPTAVADHLGELGVEADPDDVVTSAQAAARVLKERLDPGARGAVLGGDGLLEAVRAEGLEPVDVEADADALVTGYGPEVRWSAVMRAAVRIRDGLLWVASNTDATIPTPFGVAPGHGVLVDTLRRFAQVEPVVAGKPARPLLDETIRRVGGERPLMIGDRLDTDIEGARRAGIDSLLVLTGVTGLPELVAASPDERPTYLAPDLGGLREAHRAPEHEAGAWRLGGWKAHVDDGRLVCTQQEPEEDDDVTVADWWRCVAMAAWSHLDDTGTSVDVSGVRPPEAGPGAVASHA